MAMQRALLAAAPFVMAPLLTLAVAPTAAEAADDQLEVTVHEVSKDGTGKEVGTVRFLDSEYGLMAEPKLTGLKPGAHGFHIHQNGDCGPGEVEGKMTAAGAAGSHLDPEGTGAHEGPWGSGHLGDMPNIIVDSDGKASVPVVAPRLKVEEIRGRAVMVHAQIDLYDEANSSKEQGGGRAYCGVIQGG